MTSAGVQALVGHGVDPPLAEALSRRGVDATGHTARQVDAELLARADLILTFEAGQREWILRESPASIRSTLTIRRAAGVLHGLSARAEPLSFLAGSTAAYTEADEFADPHGRGSEVGEQAVAEIDDLLAVILPAIGAVPRPRPAHRRPAGARVDVARTAR